MRLFWKAPLGPKRGWGWARDVIDRKFFLQILQIQVKDDLILPSGEGYKQVNMKLQ